MFSKASESPGAWNQERLNPAFRFVALYAIQRLDNLVMLPRGQKTVAITARRAARAGWLARDHRDCHKNLSLPKPTHPLRLPEKQEWLLPPRGHRTVPHPWHVCCIKHSEARAWEKWRPGGGDHVDCHQATTSERFFYPQRVTRCPEIRGGAAWWGPSSRTRLTFVGLSAQYLYSCLLATTL